MPSLLHCFALGDFDLGGDFLEEGGGALGVGERVLRLVLGRRLVDVAEALHAPELHHRDVNVAARPQIVLDTGRDRRAHQAHRVILLEVILEPCLEHRHRAERSRAHCLERQLIHAPVRVHGEERRTGAVDTTNDEGGANVALIPEQVLRDHRHRSGDSAFPSGVEAVQRQLRADHLSNILAVGRCASSAAENIWCKVVNFVAILVSNNRSFGGPGVGPKNNTVLKHNPCNRCSRLLRLLDDRTIRVVRFQPGISLAKVEGEASHRDL
eukprot:CAMPEP_0202835438 /NCGR_PEP_ID=MMETSP1389-20130828/36654_1 /ASSEMBLY_ACC=CAM_ASM_000865 /TAXON_ID=302021 /ORGANISM="Rhodomonas sp., Strain CCMP768" /LENGTH=267 /DNA_ID=CAMNT_0049510943 /DNA_START=106 /DNA_END=909 /DNA_ORIENTATION=+